MYEIPAQNIVLTRGWFLSVAAAAWEKSEQGTKALLAMVYGKKSAKTRVLGGSRRITGL
jgi:hypothetical protein